VAAIPRRTPTGENEDNAGRMAKVVRRPQIWGLGQQLRPYSLLQSLSCFNLCPCLPPCPCFRPCSSPCLRSGW
jgi:hypothetical protein